MNLHQIASGSIGAINPFITASIVKSTGAAEDGNGKTIATYADPVEVSVQKQAISQADLKHMDNLNIQGLLTKIWVNGAWYGVDREVGQGGDLVYIGTQIWLVMSVMEIWPDWCSVIACLQRGTAPTP